MQIEQQTPKFFLARDVRPDVDEAIEIFKKRRRMVLRSLADLVRFALAIALDRKRN